MLLLRLSDQAQIWLPQAMINDFSYPQRLRSSFPPKWNRRTTEAPHHCSSALLYSSSKLCSNSTTQHSNLVLLLLSKISIHSLACKNNFSMGSTLQSLLCFLKNFENDMHVQFCQSQTCQTKSSSWPTCFIFFIAKLDLLNQNKSILKVLHVFQTL